MSRPLDVPAGKVRHPAVFGPLGRSRPLALHEARFLATLSERPVKVALPGPYLLTRTMWMECISDRAYADREALARDVVRVLREELAEAEIVHKPFKPQDLVSRVLNILKHSDPPTAAAA